MSFKKLGKVKKLCKVKKVGKVEKESKRRIKVPTKHKI